jgi:AbrB family looped-hinge helix DNA binding protein
MCVVTISTRYQITIPKEIWERFDILPGDKVFFIPHGKSIEVIFARTEKELEQKKRMLLSESQHA